MTYPIPLTEIVQALDIELQTAAIADYPGAMNGLQVANRGTVHRVAVAVDASRAAIAEAVVWNADLLIVHHGLFWGGVQPLVGIAYEKFRSLLNGDIAVYSSHLPLDMHPVLGNNFQLAHTLSLTPDAGFARFKNDDIGLTGTTNESTSDILTRLRAFAARYGGHVRTSVPVDDRITQRWAICTGGGASTETIREAMAKGVDTLIVGEGPHHTTVEAIENDLCIMYAGHYATETLGVQALGSWIGTKFGLPWTFLHLPTGS